MFNKKVLKEKVEQFIKKHDWKNISDEMEDVLAQYKLEALPYRPHLLILKDGIPFFINYFAKGDYSSFKSKFEGKLCTGFDLYKYKLLLHLQSKTGIQSGVIMWNETTDEFKFEQLDQLPNPIIFFGNIKCRANELRPKYNDVARHFQCGKCWERYPDICRQCITRNYEGASKSKRREMAMWDLNCFSNEIIIQPQLI